MCLEGLLVACLELCGYSTSISPRKGVKTASTLNQSANLPVACGPAGNSELRCAAVLPAGTPADKAAALNMTNFLATERLYGDTALPAGDTPARWVFSVAAK